MKNILVTGGAGFIGSWVAEKFIENDYNVVIIDNLSTGFRENLPSDAKFYKMDIRSNAVPKLIEEHHIDIIDHHAAQINLRKSIEDAKNDVDINVRGSINLLEAAVDKGVEKFIFSSTGGALYGEQDEFPASESHHIQPLSPYGINKSVIEDYLYYYRQMHNISYTSLRYSNVYGPRQNPYGEAGVIAIFCHSMLNSDQAHINGDGKQTRDFVFVKDVVEANLIAASHDVEGEFNISTGKETNILTIYRKLKDLCNYEREPEFNPPIEGEQRRSVLSYKKAEKELGWEPTYNLSEGLKETVDYFEQKG